MGLIDEAIGKIKAAQAAKSKMTNEIIEKVASVLGSHPDVEYMPYEGMVLMFVCGEKFAMFNSDSSGLLRFCSPTGPWWHRFESPELQVILADEIAKKICSSSETE